MDMTHFNDFDVNFESIDSRLFLVGCMNAFNNRFQAAGDSFLDNITFHYFFTN